MDILLLKASTNSSTICTCSLVNLTECIELESVFILLSIILATSTIVLFIARINVSYIYIYWYILETNNKNVILVYASGMKYSIHFLNDTIINHETTNFDTSDDIEKTVFSIFVSSEAH